MMKTMLLSSRIDEYNRYFFLVSIESAWFEAEPVLW